jgi:phage-related protein
MAFMQAVYYRDPDSRQPVMDFLESVPAKTRAALVLQIDRLNSLTDTDPPLPFPHTSQIDGELRELRCHYGSRLYRVLYRRSERLFILLHVFEKKTGAVPASDITVAQSRWNDFKRRMGEAPRRPPRAAGTDAP